MIISNLAGSNFNAGATVKLTNAGESITATNVVVTSTQITCDFDLSYRKAGKWSVNVTNTNGAEGSLANAFTILNRDPMPSWVSANGCWTATDGDYSLVMWNATATGSWTVPTGVNTLQYLVVAGGGGGGNASDRTGGGGGAGGYLNGTGFP